MTSIGSYALFSFWVTMITLFILLIGLAVISPNDKRNVELVNKVFWVFTIMVFVTLILSIANFFSGGY